ncbi:hypothetical protein AURDEDRAFT_159746 [Auricularia subglabra TFB-10046 SS5]|nr:hypothetical protein AURDEDRAFT_159746 [Auricularia subglabra TFB-10046 SS5]
MKFRTLAAVHAATCTWFLYEYLMNIDNEVELVWKRGQKWANTVYVLTNGLTISALVIGLLMEGDSVIEGDANLVKGCIIFPIFIGAWGFIVSALSDLLLTLRIYYVYDCNRRLLATSLVLYGFVLVSALVNDAINLPVHKESLPLLPVGSCFSHRNVNRFSIAITAVIGFLYQAYLGALAFARVRQAYAQRKLLRTRGFLAFLVEGNLTYYGIMVIIYGLPVIVAFRESISAESVATYYSVTTAVKHVLAHKLFRDMRRMLTSDDRDPTFSTIDSPSHEIGTVRFHAPLETEREGSV